MNEENLKTAISVKNLHKTFRIPLENSNSLKQRIVNFATHKRGYREFSPLNGISFEVKEGDFFGIVGRNGSGKSTLLKTMAGIYEPNGGSVKVNGTLVPFIELGVGFNPELTGRENVFLNGALLGFSRDEINSMYDEIVDFAELHDFMDERLKNYSSGMQVRLAFSIAIQAKGDILLLDEVLAVGDASFQQKCFDYFGELKQNKKTVILVTHSMSAVEKFCDKGILIDGGKVIAEGDNFEIAEKYQELFLRERADKRKSSADSENNEYDSEIQLESVEVIQGGKSVADIKSSKPFRIKVRYTSERYHGPGAIGVNIVNSMGNIMLAIGTGGTHDDAYSIEKGVNSVEFGVDHNIYTNGSYMINLAIAKGSKNSAQELIFQKKRATEFSIYGVVSRPHSLTHPEISVEVN